MTKKLKRLLAGILSICVSASLGIFAVACNNTPDNGDEGGNPPIGDEGNNPGGDEENPAVMRKTPAGTRNLQRVTLLRLTRTAERFLRALLRLIRRKPTAQSTLKVKNSYPELRLRQRTGIISAGL